MPLIEDIKPKKGKIKSLPETKTSAENFSVDEKNIKNSFDDEGAEKDFFQDTDGGPKHQASHDRRFKTKSLFLVLLAIILIFLPLVYFFLFTSVGVKAKIFVETKGLEKSFSSLTENVSDKNLPELQNQINESDVKTKRMLLSLQSVGQDIYSLDLLYSEGQKSKLTVLTDSIRSAHLLTSSYLLLLSAPEENVAESDFSNYLRKFDIYLYKLRTVNQELPAKIQSGKFASNLAKELTSSIKSADFVESEAAPLLSLQKLSGLSFDFFQYLSDLPKSIDKSFAFSGGEKSYLILFLNNAELRPGGGFIGSFARLDIKDGFVSAFDFEKNIYTLDKVFLDQGNVVTPPKELQSLVSAWSMRDSNMSADFPESAKKVAWFYERETAMKDRRIDGVIALDTTLFRNLLNIVGPINMPEYNMEVTAENFMRDVQYQVEIGYFQDQSNWSENQPKKILADMMPKFIKLLTSKNSDQEKINFEIIKAIKEKHLLFYFRNPKLEDLVDGAGASGKIKNSSGDYFYISDANIGGYKSSLNISQTVTQNVEIKQNGDVKEKISILRKHNGSLDWPDGVNNNFTKVFLPLTANIEKVEFVSGDNNPRSDATKTEPEKYQESTEFSKSIVSFWQNTKPKEKSQTNITYSQQNAISLDQEFFDYTLAIQKQPGVENFNWELYLVYPEGWKPLNVEGYNAEKRQIFLKETILKDSIFRLRFVRF